MEIAYLVDGAQYTAKGSRVKDWCAVEFAGSMGWHWPRRDLRYIDGTGYLDKARGSKLRVSGAQAWVNPAAEESDEPSPSYLWFANLGSGIRWLTAHGYHPLDELTVGVAKA